MCDFTMGDVGQGMSAMIWQRVLLPSGSPIEHVVSRPTRPSGRRHSSGHSHRSILRCVCETTILINVNIVHLTAPQIGGGGVVGQLGPHTSHGETETGMKLCC